MYSITSPYGFRTRPNTNKKEFTSGIDLVAKDKSGKVKALQDGTIINVGLQGDGKPGLKDPSKFKELGYYIDIKGNDGLFYRFGHLDPIKDRQSLIGQPVQAGQEIASYKTGSGSGTGPHLKMYVAKDPTFRQKIDPTPIVEQFVKGPVKDIAPLVAKPTEQPTQPQQTPNYFADIENQLAQLNPQQSQVAPQGLPQIQSTDEILAALKEMNSQKANPLEDKQALALQQQQAQQDIAMQQQKIALAEQQYEENKLKQKQAFDSDYKTKLFSVFGDSMKNQWAPPSADESEMYTPSTYMKAPNVPEELLPDYSIKRSPLEDDSYLA